MAVGGGATDQRRGPKRKKLCGARLGIVRRGLRFDHLERIVDGGAHRGPAAVQFLARAADYLAKQEAVGDLQGSREYQSGAHGGTSSSKIGCIGEGTCGSVSEEVATNTLLRFFLNSAGLRQIPNNFLAKFRSLDFLRPPAPELRFGGASVEWSTARLQRCDLDWSGAALAAGALTNGLVPRYIRTMKTQAADRLEVQRVQTGVRIEKRLLKVLKALAELRDMTLGDLLEGIVLHAFEGKQPFSSNSLKEIDELKRIYGLKLRAGDSHRLKEKS
jgi:hypothetical protein